MKVCLIALAILLIQTTGLFASAQAATPKSNYSVTTDRPIGLRQCGIYEVQGQLECTSERCTLTQNSKALSEVIYRLTQPYFQFNLFNHQTVTLRLRQGQPSGTQLQYIKDSIALAQVDSRSRPELIQTGVCQP